MTEAGPSKWNDDTLAKLLAEIEPILKEVKTSGLTVSPKGTFLGSNLCLVGALCYEHTDQIIGNPRLFAAKRLGISLFEMAALEIGFDSNTHDPRWEHELRLCGESESDSDALEKLEDTYQKLKTLGRKLADDLVVKFLPGTSSLRWAHMNLESLRLPEGSAPDWVRATEFFKDRHLKLGVDASYGGWMEDRSSFLDHTYLAEHRKFIHLGVDFNIKAGQLVTTSSRAWVELVDDDTPERHGWGLRVILKTRVASYKWVRLVYAHLERVPEKLSPGSHVSAAEPLGCVAAAPGNGGWWPHLHVQVLSERVWDELGGRIQDLDGYSRGDRSDLATHFPDPLLILLR